MPIGAFTQPFHVHGRSYTLRSLGEHRFRIEFEPGNESEIYVLAWAGSTYKVYRQRDNFEETLCTVASQRDPAHRAMHPGEDWIAFRVDPGTGKAQWMHGADHLTAAAKLLAWHI